MARKQELTPHQNKVNVMRQALMRGSGEISKVLPKHMSADEMLRFALTAAVKTPKLFDCSLESIGLALMQAGSLGVKPNGYEAHIIPYGRTATLVVDYKGLVQLMYRSPNVARVIAHAVRENDQFEYEEGTDGFVKHKIPMDCETEDERGDLIGAWAMVKFRDGGEAFVVLNKAQVLKRRAASRSANAKDSPWSLWADEMWAKTALKQLAKFAPLSAEFQRAAEWDNGAEAGKLKASEVVAELPPEVDMAAFAPEPEQQAEVIDQGTLSGPEAEALRAMVEAVSESDHVGDTRKAIDMCLMESKITQNDAKILNEALNQKAGALK